MNLGQIVRGTALVPVRSLQPRQLMPVPVPDRALPFGYRDEQVDGVWKVVVTVEIDPS